MPPTCAGCLFLRRRSTLHRVVNRSPDATRHSAVWFCNADFHASVEVVGQQQQDPGRSVTAGEYILQQLGLMYK